MSTRARKQLQELQLLRRAASGTSGISRPYDRCMRRSGDPIAPSGWLEQQTLRHCLVNTVGKETLDGLIKLVAPDGLILTGAKLLRGSEPAIPVLGDLFIPRGQVEAVQFPD